jgi:glycine/serine hydroxymethyltransferase
MAEEEMTRIGAWIAAALRHPDDEAELTRLAGEVRDCCRQFAVPGVG